MEGFHSRPWEDSTIKITFPIWPRKLAVVPWAVHNHLNVNYNINKLARNVWWFCLEAFRLCAVICLLEISYFPTKTSLSNRTVNGDSQKEEDIFGLCIHYHIWYLVVTEQCWKRLAVVHRDQALITSSGKALIVTASFNRVLLEFLCDTLGLVLLLSHQGAQGTLWCLCVTNLQKVSF